jgi:predicted amidohydrolase YtcJ
MIPEVIRIPLLRDWHTHPFLYAALAEGVHLGEATAEAAPEPEARRRRALTAIRERATEAGDSWTIAQGWNSGQYALSAEDFAGLPPVVVFNLSLHGLVVNESGRELLGRDDPELALRLDDQDWIERHLLRVLNAFATAGATAERLARFHTRLLEEHGVWHAEEMLLTGPLELALYEEAGLVGRTRVWAAPDTFARLTADERDRVHGLKFFTDGAIGARTAALSEPYRGSRDRGLLLYDDAELHAALAAALELGKPAAVHAIGDRAIDQVVRVVEALGAQAQGRIRMEHAQFLSEATARRAKEFGMTLCMQPNFSSDSVDYAERLPTGFAERNNPFRMLIDRVGFVPGDDLVFGSDGMPHGWRAALEQSLFPPARFAGQVLRLEEFVAGYGLADDVHGAIDVRIDPDAQRVTGRVVLAHDASTAATRDAATARPDHAR